MSLTEKLQNIIQSSEFLSMIRSVKSSERTDEKEFRALTNDEITVLEKNLNRAEDWSLIKVAHGFKADFILSSRFYGRCRLGIYTGSRAEVHEGIYLPTGIYDSIISDSSIGSESLISHCRLISNYIISDEAVLHNNGSIIAGKSCSFGNGLVIPAGPETGEIPVPIFADLDMETLSLILDFADKPETFSDYIAMYRNSIILVSGFIGKNATITDTPSIRDSFIGENAVINGALLVSGSTILSSDKEKTSTSTGARIENSMIQYGCGISSSASVANSLIMEHVEIESQCRVSSSVIGPNSTLGGGEVTSTVAGPFTVSHHQSLLIATIWTGGRGNIGYGANVGSNHTSRLPDQELYPGEGMFFGLGSSIKFPADYRKSPYSIISTGTVTQAQKLEFPFSLINSPSHSLQELPPFFNELIPAWVLGENIYSLLRNEIKYRKRNKAKRNTFDFTIFRPSIIDIIISARDKLKTVSEKKFFYTEKDIPGAGKNYITEKSRISAIETYTFYIQHYILTSLFEAVEIVLAEKKSVEMNNLFSNESPHNWNHARTLLNSEFSINNTIRENLELLIVSLEKIYSSAFESRKKDFTRGTRIIENYGKHHKSPEHDLSLSEMKNTTDQTIGRIQKVISIL